MQIEEESEMSDLCQSCSELELPVELCLYDNAKSRRQHALAHILAETGDVVEYGMNGDRKQSIRRAIFAAFPATEKFADLPPKERRGLVFGSVFADLQRRDERRHGTLSKRQEPSFGQLLYAPDSPLHSNHISKVSDVQRRLFHFCSICGRGFRRNSGGAVNHALWHQEKHFIFCPQCPFSHKFDSRIVLAHIEAEHPESVDAPIDRRMEEPDQLSAIVSAVFPTKLRGVVRSLLPLADVPHIECVLCAASLRVSPHSSRSIVAVLHCRQKHLDEPGVSCPKCAKNFNFASGFRIHAIEAHEDESLEPGGSVEEACRQARIICAIAFPTLDIDTSQRQSKRRLINAAATGAPLLTCLICQAQVPSRRKTYHAAKHIPRPLRPFACVVCPWSGLTRTLAISHAAAHGEFVHNASVMREYLDKCGWKSRSWVPGRRDGAQCSKCPTQIASGRFGRLLHILGHLKLRLFSCTFCSFGHSNRKHVAEHVQSDHQTTEEGSICDNTKLSQTRELMEEYFPGTKQEKLVKRKYKLWKCVNCFESVRSKHRTHHIVRRHKNLHSYECKLCTIGFNSYYVAAVHGKTKHPGVKEWFNDVAAAKSVLVPEFFPKDKQSGPGFGDSNKCSICEAMIPKAEQERHALSQHWAEGQPKPSPLPCPASGCDYTSLSSFGLHIHATRSLLGHDGIKDRSYQWADMTTANLAACQLIRRCFPRTKKRNLNPDDGRTRPLSMDHGLPYAPGVITSDNRIRCQLCRKSFLRTSVSNYTHPRDVHFPVPLYECRCCDRTFRRHWDAKLHGLKEHPGHSGVIFSHEPAKRKELKQLQRRCFPRINVLGKTFVKYSR